MKNLRDAPDAQLSPSLLRRLHRSLHLQGEQAAPDQNLKALPHYPMSHIHKGAQPMGRRTDSHHPETTTTGKPLFPVQNPQQTRSTGYYFCFLIAIEQLLMTF
ncbi:hypothetical protein B0H14DRAFT_2568030 [Mycena olivaceomarginata]|nr:hypothetical protein B0H14DRAFT_2568030 [Mycena olivaceomarginata]